MGDARNDWHVAVRAVDEADVYEALRDMSYKVRPRLKAGSDGRRLVPDAASLFQDMSEGSDAAEEVNAAPILNVDATRAEVLKML